MTPEAEGLVPATLACVHPKPKTPGDSLARLTLLRADLIGHSQEVKDVHLCGRVISTGQQSMEVWDRWRNALPVDHIVQVSASIKGEQYSPPQPQPNAGAEFRPGVLQEGGGLELPSG